MRLIDADALNLDYEVDMADDWKTAHEIANVVKYAPTVDAVPVTLVNGRINDLKNMLINTDDDEKDEIWHLQTEIRALTELLEMWAERKENEV